MAEGKDLGKVSLIFLIIAIIALSSMGIAWNSSISKFADIYHEFDIELPVLTQLTVTTRGLLFGIIIIALIAKEFIKNKKVTLVTNVIVGFAFPVVLTILIVVSLFLPLFNLSQLGN